MHEFCFLISDFFPFFFCHTDFLEVRLNGKFVKNEKIYEKELQLVESLGCFC